MYDLNISVPNITSREYSVDGKFLLLKNYLNELNEALSHALSTNNSSGVMMEEELNIVRKYQQDNATVLGSAIREKINVLKENIISTAGEIEENYTSAIKQSESQILQTVAEDFLSKSEFGEYEAETETEFDRISSEIGIATQNTRTLAAELDGFRKNTSDELTMQAESLLSQVGNLYESKETAAKLENRVNARITESADNIAKSFSESVSQINGELSAIGDEISELISYDNLYIRRGELEEGIYGVEIGRTDSNIRARFTDDKLSFCQGVSEVAYIYGNSLYITNAQFLENFKTGNSEDGYFSFHTTRNGLEVRWIDGN